MTNAHKDALFVLVKSLSKSEKRQFKLYVGRLGVNTDAKFLALFNLLDKMRKYDEVQILDSGIVISIPSLFSLITAKKTG